MSRSLKIAHVMAAVAEAWGVTTRELRSFRRTNDLIEARFAVCALSRLLTEASYPMIGRALGDRDHGSIMSGARRMEALIASSETARIRYEAAYTALLVVEKAGLAHLLGSIDPVEVAHRIDGRPERYAAMATAHEITAMARWIVEMAGPADAPDPEFQRTASQHDQETDHAA
jgi:hypothetical protein